MHIRAVAFNRFYHPANSDRFQIGDWPLHGVERVYLGVCTFRRNIKSDREVAFESLLKLKAGGLYKSAT